MTYEFHEVANIFPMMNEDEFVDLVTSIKQNGQREPIILYEDKIIDGRNRYTACKELRVEPKVEYWDEQGSLLDFVKDKNLNRRQLSQSQRGMIAARMKPLYEDEAKQRMTAGVKANINPGLHGDEGSIKGRSNEVVGKKFGISRGTVARASRVLNEGTEELQQAVDNGEVSVRKASDIAGLPKEVQNEALKKTITPTKEEKSKVAKENEEYIKKHTFPLSEDDIEVENIENDINEYLRHNMSKLQAKICSMENTSNILGKLTMFSETIRRYADDLQMTIELKNKMERDKKC